MRVIKTFVTSLGQISVLAFNQKWIFRLAAPQFEYSVKIDSDKLTEDEIKDFIQSEKLLNHFEIVKQAALENPVFNETPL